MAYPVWRAEVNSFGKIVALVKAGMIRARKRNHEFSGTLIRSNDLQQDDR